VAVSAQAVQPPAGLEPAAALRVIWHDLECGAYRADLALWRELAAKQAGPVLEIGAGTGRVTLALARHGHELTALDCDRALLHALCARAGDAAVRTLCADARRFALHGERFALCIVAMQTVQLLDDVGRRSFLSLARSALSRGGLLACAILARVEPFSCATGELGPPPDTVRLDGVLYASLPTRVALGQRHVTIERERRIAPAPDGAARESSHPFERSVVRLRRLSARQLQREASAAGFRAERAVELPATDDHAGSRVVLLRA
jgi:SAM-dependent methyltransferase